MSSTTFTEVANLIHTNYGPVVAQAFTQFGPENHVVAPNSFFGLLQRYNRVMIGSGDGSDRYAKEWAVHYATASAASFGANDAFPAASSESYNTASLEWKRVGISMEFDNLVRVAKVAARGDVRPLSREFNAKLKALVSAIETQLVSDGTGNSSKDITGALAFLSATNTYAGIDQNAASYWAAQVTNLSSATLAESHLNALTKTLWDNGSIGPNSAIVMSSTQWPKFTSLYSAQIRSTPGGLGSSAVEPRFSNGIVDLPIHVIPSMSVAGLTDEIWILNFDDLELHFLDHTPADELPVTPDDAISHVGVPFAVEQVYLNRDAKAIFLKAYPQLSCINPRNQGRLYGAAT